MGTVILILGPFRYPKIIFEYNYNIKSILEFFGVEIHLTGLCLVYYNKRYNICKAQSQFRKYNPFRHTLHISHNLTTCGRTLCLGLSIQFKTRPRIKRTPFQEESNASQSLNFYHFMVYYRSAIQVNFFLFALYVPFSKIK